jgi:hypothetical protein
VLDILQSMDYLMALKVLLQSSSGVENELIKNQPENSTIYTTYIFFTESTEMTTKNNTYYKFP